MPDPLALVGLLAAVRRGARRRAGRRTRKCRRRPTVTSARSASTCPAAPRGGQPSRRRTWSRAGTAAADARAGAACPVRLVLNPYGGAAGVAEGGMVQQRHLAAGADVELAVGADATGPGGPLQRGLHQTDMQHVAQAQDQDARISRPQTRLSTTASVSSPTKENR